jgi:hypothetical protein
VYALHFDKRSIISCRSSSLRIECEAGLQNFQVDRRSKELVECIVLGLIVSPDICSPYCSSRVIVSKVDIASLDC